MNYTNSKRCHCWHADMPYVIVNDKIGSFLGRNGKEYTRSVYCAELYDVDYAKRYAFNNDGFSAVPVSYFVRDRDAAQEYLDRVTAIRDAFCDCC